MSTLSFSTVLSFVQQYLYRETGPVSPGHLIGKTMSTGASAEAIQQKLFELDYIQLSKDGIELSPAGRYFMDDAFQKENKAFAPLLYAHEYELAILAFLAERAVMVHLEDFPALLKDGIPAHGGLINDGPLLDVLHKLGKKVESPFTSWYGITSQGREYLDFHLKQREFPSFGSRPDGGGIANPIVIHAQNVAYHSPGASISSSNSTTTAPPPDPTAAELTKLQLADFPKSVKNRKRTLQVSVIGIVASAALSVLIYLLTKS